MNPIRARVESILAGTGAFLRCDRGAALYVTNLPMLRENWQDAARLLAEAGMAAEQRGRLIFIAPSTRWARETDRWALDHAAPGELTRQLEKRRDQPICDEEVACWIEGLKRLELPRGAAGYERLVRQAAAVALRKGCGGLIASCALCLDMLKEMNL